MSNRLLPALLLIAACNGGDAAQFSSASNAQLARALQAGSGGDASSALFVAMAFSASNDATACPRTQTTGDETIVTGGCDNTSDHSHWEGKLTIDNVAGFATNPEYDATKPSIITFEGLRTTGTDSNGKAYDTTFDGTVKGTGLRGGGPSSLDSDDLVVTAYGVEVSEVIHFTAAVDQTISPSSETTLDITDLGSATVEGSWKMSDPPSGKLTLHGADDITFDLSTENPDTQCIGYTDGDKTGTVCPPTN